MAFLWHAPVIPSRMHALQRDCAANPLQPTPIGTQLACHPRLRHSTKLAYLARFLSLASYMCTSQGTVNASRTTCFLESENITFPPKKTFLRFTDNCKKMFKTHARKITTAEADIVKLKTTGNKLVASFYINAVNDY